MSPSTGAHLIPGTARIGKENASESRPGPFFDAFSSREPVPTPHQVRGRLSLENALAAPAGQETAPAAGLRFRRSDLFRKFVARRVLIDPGILGGADDRDHRWNRRGA